MIKSQRFVGPQPLNLSSKLVSKKTWRTDWYTYRTYKIEVLLVQLSLRVMKNGCGNVVELPRWMRNAEDLVKEIILCSHRGVSDFVI